jgi:hypothetical protein
MDANCPGIGEFGGKPVTGVAGPDTIAEATTFREVMYVSNGAIGPMARESYPRMSFSLPR